MARLERKPGERVAIAGAIIQFVGAVLAFVFWQISAASSAWILAWQVLIGCLVWIVTLMHLRVSRLAEDESEEWQRLQAERAAGGARGRLFEEDEIQAFAARNRLRVFEKYVAPVMSLVLALLLAAVVVAELLVNVTGLTNMTGGKEKLLIGIAGISGLTFILFLVAMYAGGMSRQAEWRPLRAGSSYMMFCALFGAATVISFALGQFGFRNADDAFSYAMLPLLAIIVVEIILNFVLDFYRPRLEGVEARPAYDSRLLGLLAQPGGILKTVSATLDYQFGFRVSQTWFYRFIEGAIAPLILFQIITLYLLTCLVIVGPEQRGVLERFGRFKGPVLEPGLCVKLPWPFDRVYRFPANEIKTIYLGHAGEAEKVDKILWTVKHYETEYPTMVATSEVGPRRQDIPVNLLVATTTVRYKIADVQKWYYSSSEPEKLLESLCEREQIKYLAGADLFGVMGVGRDKVGEDLRKRMQAAAEDARLGVEIIGVGVEGMHPPVVERLPQAFQELVSSLTQREVGILDARTSEIATVRSAQTEAEGEKLKARGVYASRVHVAQAEAECFAAQNKAYGSSPEVFKAREFLSALEKAFENPRKYVLGTGQVERQVIRLNLEDPYGLDITQVEFAKPVMGETKK